MNEESIIQEEEPVQDAAEEKNAEDVLGRVYPLGTRIVSLLDLEV